jgi:hypothetical protein
MNNNHPFNNNNMNSKVIEFNINEEDRFIKNNNNNLNLNNPK